MYFSFLAESERNTTINRVNIIRIIIGILISIASVSAFADNNTIGHSFKIIPNSYSNTHTRGTIHFELDEGWITYWKTPGAVGFPLTIQAKTTDAAHKVVPIELTWPAPERFFEKDFQYLAHTNELLIPFTIAGTHKNLELYGDYAVCSNICIPYNFNEVVSFGTQSNDVILDKSLNNLPQSISGDAVKLSISADQNVLSLSFVAPQSAGDIQDVIVSAGPDFEVLRPHIISVDGHLTALAEYLQKPDSSNQPITEQIEDIYLIGAYQNFKLASDGQSFSATGLSWSVLLGMLGLAFIGGFILNLMPCVLPVLALKINQINHSHQSVNHSWQLRFVALGIIAASISAAGLVYLLQSFGHKVGWGFHFQQPLFISFMMLSLIFLAHLQLGLFTFKASSSITNALNLKLSRLRTDRPVYHLFYGFFIAVLASPCTAPFLGAAVAFALGLPLAGIMAVFGAIGLGLALPYLALSLVPNSGRLLLKIKPFSRYVSYVGAAMLYVTALWFAWILSHQAGLVVMVVSLVTAHLILAIAYYKHWFVQCAPLYIALILMALLPNDFNQTASETAQWHSFDQQMLTQTAQSSTVFVDVGADWCLTCQYNELTVLNTQPVQDAFAKNNVYLMHGDMTQSNPELLAFIRRYQRAGVPFNAVFRGNEVTVLSELLSNAEVIEAISPRQPSPTD